MDRFYPSTFIMDSIVQCFPNLDRKKIQTIMSIATAVAFGFYAYLKISKRKGKDLKAIPVAPGWYPFFGIRIKFLWRALIS